MTTSIPQRPRTVGLLLTILLLAPALAGCLGGSPPAPGDDGARELVVLTHESFNPPEELVNQFENDTNSEVVLRKAGDANEVLNMAILFKDAPVADVLFGVDNAMLSKALANDLFTPYEPNASEHIADRFVLDDRWRATPVDHGYVALNYDKAALQEAGLEPPQDLKELTEPRWKGKLVVEDPRTSSPGNAFLLTTVARFGTTGDYTYEDYWQDLKENDVLVSPGWSTAYYTHFSLHGGDRPVVVSYTTSPAFELFYGDENLTEPPSGNVIAPQTTWHQIEFAGILNGTDQEELAQAFIDLLVSEPFQERIPATMAVYPVRDDVQPPAWFSDWAPVPEDPATLPSEDVVENQEAYQNTWFSVMVS